MSKLNGDAVAHLDTNGFLELATLKQTKLLKAGYTKLGNRFLMWSIPPLSSCPGKTATCSEVCFGDKGLFKMPGVDDSLELRKKISERDDFTYLIVREAVRRKPSLVRIHGVGDFYAKRYIEDWHFIARSLAIHRKRFLFYTRSWRVPELQASLYRLCEESNVVPWFSLDRQSGYPDYVPKNVRLAYLQVDDQDIPTRSVDLVFRDHKLRRRPVKRVAGALVCPAENGVKKQVKVTCSTCQLCTSALGDVKDPRRVKQPHESMSKRLALPMA